MRFPRPTAALLTLALAAAALLIGSPATQAHPEPEIVSPSWQLDFEYQQPDTITVQGLDGERRTYWYLPYTVTNRSGEDRLFVPEFTIATDAGDIFPTDQGVPTTVFDAVQNKLNNNLLESSIAIVGPILQGNDYAKDGVAIWPAFDEDVDEFSIFVTGLSGETAEVLPPNADEPMLLRRTLMLTYQTPGTDNPADQQPLRLIEQREVMR